MKREKVEKVMDDMPKAPKGLAMKGAGKGKPRRKTARKAARMSMGDAMADKAFGSR